MKKSVKTRFVTPIISLATCTVLLLSPVTASAEVSGSDFAFDQMVLKMVIGRDTGSMWIDRYVETLNQDIAAKAAEEPYGLAGPNGPVSGFDGYLAGFISPDTGSIWFNTYVDNVNRLLREKEQLSPRD